MLRRSCVFSKQYSLVCIGGGVASIAAAIRARDFGKSVLIVEEKRLGGRDVWQGTIESKALWEIAKFSAQCRGSSFRRCINLETSGSKNEVDKNSGESVTPSSLVPDFEVTQKTILEACLTRESQIKTQLSSSGVDVMFGRATFTSPYSLTVYDNDGNFENVESDYYIIATGSRPRRPSQFKPDGKYILNSEQIWGQPFPKSLLVVGSGGVGTESASIYANLGTTKVTLLERSDHILPRTDEDVVQKVKQLFREKDVELLEGYDLNTLKVENDQVKYGAKCIRTGIVHEGVVDKALVALGRVPNFESLGLENLENTVVANGRIKCDRFGRVVPYRHIYASGDAAGGKSVPTAETQGRSVVEHMFSFRTHSGERFNESNETQLMFLDQEVATVGWNETRCRQNAVAYKAATYSYEYTSRALAMNSAQKGFVKIIVSNDRQQTVLGCCAIGPQSSAICEIASVAVQQKRQVHEFVDLFCAYPSISAAFSECARSLVGQSMIKPGRLPGITINNWSPSKPRGRGYTSDERKADPFVIDAIDKQ